MQLIKAIEWHGESMPHALLVQDTKIPLEDAYTDVLGKAQRGRHLTDAELALRAGIRIQELSALKEGHYQETNLDKVAFALGLHSPSLQALAKGTRYPNAVPEIPGFKMFTTVYRDMTVNAYLIWDPVTKLAATFDTGSTAEPILDAVAEKTLSLQNIYITHTHMDHLADVHRLLEVDGASGYGPGIENPLSLKHIRHGDGFALGHLRIRVLGTSGHTPGGLSYFITGLEKPLVVVGDALFASSQGGATLAYEEALKNNREKILSLPLETVICPGHGPLTTVGEERDHNPFFPELKASLNS